MRSWFARLSVHSKLVAMALVVTTAALAIATTGLMALDLWRYRQSALDDTAAMARVVAENTAAAVRFGDVDSARTTLMTVRVRPTVERACLYLPEGRLFASFERTPETPCPDTLPPRPSGWLVVSSTAEVSSNNEPIATVYVERHLTELAGRIAIASVAALAMLIVTGAFAFVLSSRLHRVVSTPITALASAARSLESNGPATDLPPVGDDEVGDLVRAFTEMRERVSDAKARLVETNEQLRQQEAERERLLVREREANRLKDEFLAAVSHELRTPLNAISGWAQILTHAEVDHATLTKGLSSIARNARVQTRLIEDLVDVSRILTGKLTTRFAPVDLHDVTEAAVDALRGTALDKGVILHVHLPDEPCQVNGDRDRLHQVIWNLLSNAIKFTPAQGIVTLTLRPTHAGFELEVRDTGVGIPASFLPLVFDRFRQADGSTTRAHGGLGLGLAIVKELTERHDGSVRAASGGLGAGAVFTVRLPRLATIDARADRGDAAPTLGADVLAGLDILAVDDNPDALDVLAASLSRRGARVRIASSGPEAVREWDRQPADLLVCDLAMPHMDGFDVLRRIRERDRQLGRTTRAVALTAHASSEMSARTRDAGFAAHVPKPFDSDALVRAVRAARAVA